jgi:hypothetical protein
VEVRIALDDREVRNSLKALRREGPKAIADAMNRVGFDALEALSVEVRSAFPSMGAKTSRFLSRTFLFDKATPTDLTMTVRPKGTRNTQYDRPPTPEFIAEHAFGLNIKPDRERLTFGGKLAVPVGAKRGAGGKVKPGETPRALLEAGRGGFVTPRAIFQRIPGGRRRSGRKGRRLRDAKLMYLLLERPVRLKQSLDFFGTVERTIRRELPKKAARVLEKINLRRGR